LNYTNVTTSRELKLFFWDDAKNESNQRKHGISFECAKLVFDDPLHVSRQDRIENGEQRWQTVGMVGGVALLLVAHTWYETDSDETGLSRERIRIISARLATRLERKIYEQGT
jgi:uncharacterized DUF497 family protein